MANRILGMVSLFLALSMFSFIQYSVDEEELCRENEIALAYHFACEENALYHFSPVQFQHAIDINYDYCHHVLATQRDHRADEKESVYERLLSARNRRIADLLTLNQRVTREKQLATRQGQKAL